MAVRDDWAPGEVLTSTDLNDTFAAKLTIPPAWTSYTPTATAETGSLTSFTASGAYTENGKLIVARFDVNITNAGTGAGILKVSLPKNAKSALQYGGFATEYTATGFTLNVGVNSGVSVGVVEIKKYDNSSIIATNRRIIGIFTYEAA